jgi:hypothetical protein
MSDIRRKHSIRLRKLLSDYLRKGQSSGQVDPDLDPDFARRDGLIDILLDAVVKESGTVGIPVATAVPGICRAQIGCGRNVPWWAWEKGWQAPQVGDH